MQRNALMLAEAGNLLMVGGRAKDSAAWMKWAQQQREAATTALEAARAKDADALSEAGDQVYETCEGCHKVYVPGAV